MYFLLHIILLIAFNDPIQDALCCLHPASRGINFNLDMESLKGFRLVFRVSPAVIKIKPIYSSAPLTRLNINLEEDETDWENCTISLSETESSNHQIFFNLQPEGCINTVWSNSIQRIVYFLVVDKSLFTVMHILCQI